jgi:hypothetical protein
MRKLTILILLKNLFSIFGGFFGCWRIQADESQIGAIE